MDHSQPKVAYFCMEYGLHEDLPLYAGGLGILAGDTLKAAKELNKPMVGIGILWSEGYTYQKINDSGWPYDTFPTYECSGLTDTGVIVNVEVRGETVPVKVWKTEEYGNVPLYLLDTNLPDSPHAWITRRLYGGMDQDRVAQEIVLGIGGIRALRALNIPVDIYHFNEGHAVFAGVELIREKMQQQGLRFDAAWKATVTECVFTTHTPVMAGNESHDHGLLQYMGAYNTLNYDQMKAIGGDPFAMTVAGLRLSHIANGVAKLHGKTARAMWEDVCNCAPIIDITNGIHRATWQDEDVRRAYFSGVGLWEAHVKAKNRLIREVREMTGVQLDPEVLLIGFARRAAPYKRSDLIFHRPEIIEPLLQAREVQLVFSGKAHPQDDIGKGIISNLVKVSRRHPNTVVFLENYNMKIGKLMTAGSDVWLNNPKRPLEASGTSGMKAAMNGVLNLSVLDGWWPEGCIHGVNGWQVGSGYEGPNQTEHDVAHLYEVLLKEVIPTYYNDRVRWQAMMRASIDMSIERFSASRMLQEYYNLMYWPETTNQRVKRLKHALTR